MKGILDYCCCFKNIIIKFLFSLKKLSLSYGVVFSKRIVLLFFEVLILKKNKNQLI
jgi:hypothetical protein